MSRGQGQDIRAVITMTMRKQYRTRRRRCGLEAWLGGVAWCLSLSYLIGPDQFNECTNRSHRWLSIQLQFITNITKKEVTRHKSSSYHEENKRYRCALRSKKSNEQKIPKNAWLDTHANHELIERNVSTPSLALPSIPHHPCSVSLFFCLRNWSDNTCSSQIKKKIWWCFFFFLCHKRNIDRH